MQHQIRCGKQLAGLGLVSLLGWMNLQPGQQSLAADQNRYRLVQAVDGASLVSKVNELAASGYRIAVWDAAIEPVALLERLPDNLPARYQYAVVDRDRTGFIKDADLNRLGANGFRLLPWTAQPRILLLEKDAGRTATFEYRWQGLVFGFQKKKLRDVGEQGYCPAGILAVGASRGTAAIALLERSSQANQRDPGGRFIEGEGGSLAKSTEQKLANLKQRLADAAAEGYRVQAGEHVGGGSWDLKLCLRKDRENAQRVAYRLENDPDPTIFETLLNRAGAEHFRLLPTCVFFTGANNNITFKRNIRRMAAVLENDPAAPERYEYRLVTSSDLPELLEKVNEAAGEDFRPRAMLPGPAGYIVVVEKISQKEAR